MLKRPYADSKALPTDRLNVNTETDKVRRRNKRRWLFKKDETVNKLLAIQLSLCSRHINGRLSSYSRFQKFVRVLRNGDVRFVLTFIY
jgi:hypothetical protein